MTTQEDNEMEAMMAEHLAKAMADPHYHGLAEGFQAFLDEHVAKAMADPHYHGLGEGFQAFLDEHGIVPERITPNAYSCCIGFSEREQKWYGWSHRAIHGHGIGETVGPGHLAYNEERGTWTAQTLDDAKQMAIDYYRGVA